MWERYSVVGVAVSLAMLFADFYLLRKGKIQGRSFALWLLVAIVIGLFSGIPPLFILIYILFGTENIVNAIMAAGFLFFVLAIFYLHYRLSELHSLLMKLAMEISVRGYTEGGQETNLETKRRKRPIIKKSET